MASEEDLKLWEAAGGTIHRREYANNRKATFYRTNKGKKYDSWVRAKEHLFQFHPELLAKASGKSYGSNKAGSGENATGQSSGSAAQSKSTSAPLTTKNTNKAPKAPAPAATTSRRTAAPTTSKSPAAPTTSKSPAAPTTSKSPAPAATSKSAAAATTSKKPAAATTSKKPAAATTSKKATAAKPATNDSDDDFSTPHPTRRVARGKNKTVLNTPSPSASVEIVESEKEEEDAEADGDEDEDEDESGSEYDEDEDEDEDAESSSSDEEDSDWEPGVKNKKVPKATKTKPEPVAAKKPPPPSPAPAPPPAAAAAKRQRASSPAPAPAKPAPKRQRGPKKNISDFFAASTQGQPQPGSMPNGMPNGMPGSGPFPFGAANAQFAQQAGFAPNPAAQASRQMPQQPPNVQHAQYARAGQPPQQAQQQPRPQHPQQPQAQQPQQAQQAQQAWNNSGVAAAVAAAITAAAQMNQPQPMQIEIHTDESHQQVATKYYKAGHFGVAEERYTLAIKELEESTSETRDKDLKVLFGNRAASRLKQGKVDLALEDNWQSLKLDRAYTKAYARICDCHLRRGDIEKAKGVLKDAMEQLKDLPDKKPELDQKLAQINDVEKSVRKLMQDVCRDTSSDQLTKVLNDAKPLIEQLHDSEAIKIAQSIVHLRLLQFKQVLSVCTQVQTVAWQWWLVLQVKYHEGNLAEAIQLAGARPAAAPEAQTALDQLGMNLPSAQDLTDMLKNMNELQSLKNQGNQAISQKQSQLASEKYTAALALYPPPGFAAILYSNRARAFEMVENHMDALADCGRAKALNPAYTKPYLRLSGLLTEFRRPSEAASVLQDLQEQLQPGSKDCIDTQTLLGEVQVKARFLRTPDHYKFLCLQQTCTEDDVRKAYKRRALTFHPDKAIGSCKCGLQMGNSGFALVSSEVHARIKKESHTLFTYIAEAYEQLSDVARRKMVDKLLTVENTALQNALKAKPAAAHHPTQRWAHVPPPQPPPPNTYPAYNFNAQHQARQQPQPQPSTSQPQQQQYQHFQGAAPRPAMYTAPPAGMGAAPGFGVPPPAGPYQAPPAGAQPGQRFNGFFSQFPNANFFHPKDFPFTPM